MIVAAACVPAAETVSQYELFVVHQPLRHVLQSTLILLDGHERDLLVSLPLQQSIPTLLDGR